MKFTRTAVAIALALGTTSLATVPALAKDTKEQAKPAERKFNVSAEARKAIGELQTTVNAKDMANFPAKLAAAQAVAKNSDDKYVIAKLQLQAVAPTNNAAQIIPALEALVNSGGADASETAMASINIAKLAYNEKDYAKASTYVAKVLAIDPNNSDALILNGEALNNTGKHAEGVESIRKAIAIKTAAGQKADESWYKRAVALANNNKLPNVNALALDWVKAYPTATNWRDTLRIYQTSHNMTPVAAIDVARLMFATKSMASENDYYRLADPLVSKGFPGEAKAVLEEGFAKGAISKSSAAMGQLYAAANAKAAGDRASLDAAAKVAAAQPLASKLVVIADAYAGYGDYAKAIPLYKAALAKSGADKDLINLRIGIAQARSGDKAGASATFAGVGGAQADIAKLWLVYVGTMA